MIGGGLAVLSCLVVFDAWRIGSELQTGRSQLENVRHGDVRGVGAMRSMTKAAVGHVRHADELAHHSLGLRAISAWPIAGRQVATVRNVADAAARAGNVADDAFDAMYGATRRPLAAGSDRLRLLQQADEILRVADARLAHIRVAAPRGFVVPPLRNAVTRMSAQITSADLAIQRARSTVAAVTGMLQGPRTYLVLAANNAEMRGSGGMPLQVGTLTFNGGDITPGAFRPTSDLLLPSSVPIPPELESLYGWLSPGREWRNTGSSANFPEIAPVYRAMAAAAGIGPVDGVMQLDVVTLGDILGVIGPVKVEGVCCSAEDVGRLILHDQYALYAPSQVGQRREALGALATATVQAMKDRSWEPASMLAALTGATHGRHVMLWSSAPAEEQTWQRLGADGALRADGLLVGVQNQTGNKLDYFVHPSVALSVSKSEKQSRVTMRVRVPNSVAPSEVAYVAGNDQQLPFGTYHGLVTVYLPGTAFNARVAGGSVVASGQDGPMRVLAIRLDVGPRATRDIRVQFSLPAGQRQLVVLPSGRATPIAVRWKGATMSDAKGGVLRW